VVELISIRKISGNLHLRGINRLNGDPRLGILGVFLLFILVVRTAVNLYLIQSLAAGSVKIDASQVSGAILAYTALWGCLAGAMHMLRILKVIPKGVFINDRPPGITFRNTFRRQIILRYPVNYISLLLIVSSAFLIPSVGVLSFLVHGIVVFISMMVAFIVLEKLPDEIIPESQDLQFLEVIFLLFTVALNPDLVNKGNMVVIQSQGVPLPVNENTALIVIPVVVLILLIAFILLVLIKKGERKAVNHLSLPVLVLWYGRVIGKIWFVLYLIILPLFYSPYTGEPLKRMLSVGSLIWGVFSAVMFGGFSSLEVEARWNRSIFQAEHRRLWVPVFIVAIALGSVPLLFLLCVRYLI